MIDKLSEREENKEEEEEMAEKLSEREEKKEEEETIEGGTSEEELIWWRCSGSMQYL